MVELKPKVAVSGQASRLGPWTVSQGRGKTKSCGFSESDDEEE